MNTVSYAEYTRQKAAESHPEIASGKTAFALENDAYIISSSRVSLARRRGTSHVFFVADDSLGRVRRCMQLPLTSTSTKHKITLEN